jgi:hypothetical protein
MSLREVTKAFQATRLVPDSDDSCSGLEGYDTSGDVCFSVGTVPLNDGLEPRTSLVNGKQFVRFVFGIHAYCVEAAIYEASTKRISGQ